MKNEVLVYAPDAYVDGRKTKIGYEINFTKYFYKAKPLKEIKEILGALNKIDEETKKLMDDIVKDLSDE